MTAADENVPPAEDAREARYAEAIEQSPNGVWTILTGPTRLAPSFARAVITVADAELAPLRARVAELEAERLQLHADMNHNWRRFKEAEAKRNEWFEMWKQANVWSWEERDLRVAAEAALARVEALADEYPHRLPTDALRAALAAAGPAVSDGEGATSEAVRRATFAEVSRAMNRIANVWEDDGSDPCRVRITREYANAYRAYAEGLGEPTGSKREDPTHD